MYFNQGFGNAPFNPCGSPCGGGFPVAPCNTGGSSFAIVLVLFILLVIVIGSRAFR